MTEKNLNNKPQEDATSESQNNKDWQSKYQKKDSNTNQQQEDSGSNVTALSFKDSFDNAIEVNNYPWGFRLKTKRRTWIETDKNKGDRVCFCTLNPKTNKWCAVKK